MDAADDERRPFGPVPAPQSPDSGAVQGIPPEMLTWAVSAVGSGVLGNAAYDWMRKGLTKLLAKRRYRRAAPSDCSDLLAVLAVQARCGELGMRVPKRKALRCTGRSVASTGLVVVHVESRDLNATVTVPADPWVQAPEVFLRTRA